METILLNQLLDEGVDNEIEDRNTMPSQLGAFILSNSKRIMNNFVRVVQMDLKQIMSIIEDTDSSIYSQETLERIR